LSGTKSVIVIGINYYREAPPTPKNHGAVARYAFGKDYHKVIKKILKELEKFIKTLHPETQTKICVDSAPLPEKYYAVQAGLGFIGKNNTLITKEFGSYVLLGEILTTLKLNYDKPIPGTCGTCTRCLSACPTRALTNPYTMDARRCISYLTIENKTAIPKKFHTAINNRIFGCDACQDVCPYNKSFANPTNHRSLKTKIAGSALPLKEILALRTDEQFTARFAGSPLMRAKRKRLQRNARIIMDQK
jgi:epoxyqueuosine reductase